MKRVFLALLTGLWAISLTLPAPGGAFAHGGCCKKEEPGKGGEKACANCVKKCAGCQQEGKQHTCKDCRHKKPATPGGQK